MINLIAVVAATIVSMVIGAAWYSPILFGNVWIQAMGFSKSDMEKAKKKGMGKQMGVMFLGTLLTSYVVANLLQYVNAVSAGEALQLGLLVWLGFIVPVVLSSVLWEGKSVKVYLINIAHYLVVLEVTSVILAVWH